MSLSLSDMMKKKIVRIYVDIEVEEENDYDAISEAFNELEKIIENPSLSLEEIFEAKVLQS